MRSGDSVGCRLKGMDRLRFRPVVAATLLFVATLTGCATTGSNQTSCVTKEVSPSSQPGGKTPRAALDAVLKAGQPALPKGIYHLEGHSGTRYVFANGLHKVSVSKLPTTGGEPAVWVVLLTYDCS